MKAFLLAAGRGERMGSLTDTRPKPLLEVGGRTLLDWQIDRLIAAGIDELIVNTAYLGDMIARHLAARSFPVAVTLSEEHERLETAGALYHALDRLGDAPFLLVNADIWTDFDYAGLIARLADIPRGGGYLILVDNPPYKNGGDFALDGGQIRSLPEGDRGYTFSGISLLSPVMISEYPKRRQIFPLKEVFDWALARGQLSGEIYGGCWLDVGTPERLAELRAQFAAPCGPAISTPRA